METRHLTTSDFYALRNLLDDVFSRKYGKETRFVKLFPRLFTEPKEEVMHAHLGTFDGDRLVGTAAMYPLDYVVGGEHIRLIANGNVAVHWEYEGRRIMSRLLDAINDACDPVGDVCYLHGKADRYGRWGYISNGVEYLVTFQPKAGAYEFVTMEDAHMPVCKALSEQKVDYILRKPEDFIPALCSGRREAIAVLKNGQVVGGMSLGRENAFVEEFMLDGAIEGEVFGALAHFLGKPATVRMSGYDVKTVDRCRDIAAVKQAEPALMRILQPERLREAARAAGVAENVIYTPYLT